MAAGGELNLRHGTPGSRPFFGANLGALALGFGKGTASAVLARKPALDVRQLGNIA